MRARRFEVATQSTRRRRPPRWLRRARLGEVAIAASIVGAVAWILVTGAITAVQAVNSISSLPEVSGASGPTPTGGSGASGVSGPTGTSGPSGAPGASAPGGSAPGSVFTSMTTFSTPAGTYFSFPVVVNASAAVSVSESGELPDGVLFDPSSGTLYGTPGNDAEGAYALTFTASDGVSPNETQSFTLVVGQPSTIDFPTSELPITDIGENYAAQLPAPSGAVGAVTYSIEWGNLPAGLTLDPATGAITGDVPANDPGTAPWTTELYDFEATVTDSQGNVASQYFYVIVFPRLSLPSANLPAAAPGDTYYSLAIAAEGGSGDSVVAPYFCDPTALSCTQVGTGDPGTAELVNEGYGTSEYHFAVSAGTLPPGLSIDPAYGTITGTVSPSAPTGSDTFTLTVTDTAGATATQSYTIVISDDAPSSGPPTGNTN